MTMTKQFCLLLFGFVCIGCSQQSDSSSVDNEPDSAPSQTGLVGTWYAEPVFNNTTGHVAFEIINNQQAQLEARLLLLDIDASPIPVGNITIEGNQLKMGSTAFTLGADLRSFSGSLPSSVVPVHDIPMTFNKVAELPSDAEPSSALPEATISWQFQTGGPVWSGIEYHEGRVYFGSDDGSLYALDALTGEQIWQFDIGSTLRARPVIAGEHLLAQADNGYLYRLDLHGGSLEWQAQLQDSPQPRLSSGDPGFNYDYYASAAVVADQHIYIGSADGRLQAVNLQDGSNIWSFTTQGPITTTPAITTDQVIIGSHDGNVYALDPATGRLLWQYDTGAPVTSSPAVYQEMVITGSRSYDIIALNLANGTPVWNSYYWFSWVESSPVVSDDIAYIGSSDAQLISAIDAATGQQRWQFDTGGSAWMQPAVSDTAVFIGSVGVADYLVDHQAAFYAIDKNTGLGIWQLQMQRPPEAAMWGFASSPAIGANHVFVGNLDGTVYAIPVNPAH